MFNEPEWASKDEWDAYAWFGFAISEAQALERLLLVIAVAINQAENHSPKKHLRSDLYQQLRRRTLGGLCTYLGRYPVLSKEISEMLKRAVTARNALAHEFFVPTGASRPPLEAKKELQQFASLFSHVSMVVESIIWTLLDDLDVQGSALLVKRQPLSN